MVVKPNNPNAKVQLSDPQAAARFGVQLIVLTASAEDDLDPASMMVRRRVSALLTGVD